MKTKKYNKKKYNQKIKNTSKNEFLNKFRMVFYRWSLTSNPKGQTKNILYS